MKLQAIPTGISTLDQILGADSSKVVCTSCRALLGPARPSSPIRLRSTRVARGGKVAYVTLLAEEHARMMQHMETFSFFREDAIPGALHYVSAFDALIKEGLSGVVKVSARRSAHAKLT